MTQRKDGRWQQSATIAGKRMYFYSSASTQKAAEKDIHNQMLNYREKVENGADFATVADSWYALALEKLEDTTTVRYKSLKNRCVDYFGDSYIKEIKPFDVEKFLLKLTRENFSTKSIKDHLSVLRLIFKHGIVYFDAENNPAAYISIPKGKSSKPRNALTEEEQEVVKNSIDKPFGLYAITLLYTGMRRGEAIALKWSDIDFERKIITVADNAVFPTNQPKIKNPKSDAGARKIILIEPLAKILFPLVPADRSQFVFSGDTIRGNSWYTRQWKTFRKATELDVTPHQLRHTYATMLFEADIDIKDAQNLMGHADISTTRNIYTHVREKRLEETAAKLNNFIK